MTDTERDEALLEIRARLDALAALQMHAARDITRIRERVDALADSAQTSWDAIEEIRAEIERRLRT